MLLFWDLWSYGVVDIFYDLVNMTMTNCKACLMYAFLIFFLVCRYDAITVKGELDWQNKLNKYNKPFFDLCDGLFANYTWKVTLFSYCLPL